MLPAFASARPGLGVSGCGMPFAWCTLVCYLQRVRAFRLIAVCGLRFALAGLYFCSSASSKPVQVADSSWELCEKSLEKGAVREAPKNALGRCGRRPNAAFLCRSVRRVRVLTAGGKV